jgi:hypothetical protein
VLPTDFSVAKGKIGGAMSGWVEIASGTGQELVAKCQGTVKKE